MRGVPVPIRIIGRKKTDATGKEMPDTTGAKLNRILVYKGGKYSKDNKPSKESDIFFEEPTIVQHKPTPNWVPEDTPVKDIVEHNKEVIKASPKWGAGAKQKKEGGPGMQAEPNLKSNDQSELQKNIIHGRETRPQDVPVRDIASKMLRKKKKGG